MLTKAAITYGKGEAFQIQDVQIADPKPGEILVRVVASGICHSDMVARDQKSGVPLPAVLGHEGSGIVEKVGENVTGVDIGDHVILTFSSCGKCKNCHSGMSYVCDSFFALNFHGDPSNESCGLSKDGQKLNTFFGQSSFAHYSLTSERNIIKVSKEIPLEIVGPLGCGIQTGAGTIFNKLKPDPGSSVVVFGCGAVGLSAIMAAKVHGCTTIIAVDIHEDRLELAKELGATHTINSKSVTPVDEIMRITGTGANYAVESTGLAFIIRQSVDCLAPLGTSAIIGSIDEEVSLNIRTLRAERTITGVIEGSSVPQVFIPQLIDLYRKGLFPFDKLIKFYDFEDINQAVQDSESGKTIKPVLKM